METVTNWRATYVPGRWVVLAGPTSVVIMQPAPAHMSGLLNDLWLDVVSAADVADLAQKFSAFRLDLMPHFAAFFWAEDGMHSLIRGGLSALDAETGDVVAQGEGFHTWNEVGLQSVRQVRVDMDELDAEPGLQLPLAVGIVLADSVTIDATQKVHLVLPTVPAGAEAPAVEPIDEDVVLEPIDEEPVPEPADGESEAEDIDVEPPDNLHASVALPAEEPVLPDVPELSDQDAEALPPEDSEQYEAEQSLPIETDYPQPVPAEDSVDENLHETSAPVEPNWPASPAPVGHPDRDAWGVRDGESVVPVDLFVDEDGDGIPDAQQSGLDLESEPADVTAESVALEVEAPEAPQVEGFPGWNRAQQAPYAPPPAGPYGPQQGQVPTGPGMPFAVPLPSAAPYAAPQAPSYPGQAYPGQPFPGQPFPGQPFPGQPMQGQPGQYGPPQRPTYPPSPYGRGPLSPNGAPMTSPVPPPAAYAPAAPPPQGPGAPSEPGLPVSADSADSDSTVFSTGIAMTHKPVAPRQGTDNLVLAVVCSFAHPNPPGSPRCRRCGQPVDNANPRLVHKPVMAQLITAGGARIELTDTVLIGRAPAAQAGDGNPILLPVPSPNSDISRTHLKVAVKDWDIVATDLHSTNGTMLVRPGQAPVRMMPGTPVTVEPGTILDLGDGGVITVGLPA